MDGWSDVKAGLTKNQNTKDAENFQNVNFPHLLHPLSLVTQTAWLASAKFLEMNISETAFVTKLPGTQFETGDSFGLRWFTPSTEVII